MAFYLKYRPQILDDLIGQEQIVQSLKSAFLSNKLSHAYLFCGPRGSGKTSTARILAKMVNCQFTDHSSQITVEDNSNIEKIDAVNREPITDNQIIPCNKCDSCLAVNNGSNIDLIEIDAASNRGIDDIRTLRENIKLSPSIGKKKVYIIDEVHMLTTEAFNALLKTLEEPPTHVLFILATTEVHKIPQTILSRVQRLDFSLASKDDLFKLLKKVSESEKIEIDDGSLNLIVSKADGAYRDGLKLLDQISSGTDKVTTLTVEEFLKTGSSDDQALFLENILKKDSPALLQDIQNLVKNGTNIKDFTSRLIETFRLLLLKKQGVVVTLPSNIEKLANDFSLELIVRSLEQITESLNKLKYTSIPSLPLEIAVIKITENSEFRVHSEENRETITASEAKPARPAGGQSNKETEIIEIATDTMNLQPDNQESDSKILNSELLSHNSDDIMTLKEKWNYILETIRPYNFSLEALLKQSKMVRIEDGTLVLEVPYSFHQRILEAPKSRGLMESVVSDVLGKSIKVSCILGKRPVRVEELANVELAADDEMIRLASEIFNS